MIHLKIGTLVRYNKVGHRIGGNCKGQSDSRGLGWGYVHISKNNDYCTNFTDILPGQKAMSSCCSLETAGAYYASPRVTVIRAKINGSGCY